MRGHFLAVQATPTITRSHFLAGVGDIFVSLLSSGINRRRAQSGLRKRKIVTGQDKQPNVAARCNHETTLHYCYRYGFCSRVNYDYGRTEKTVFS
jgi:hypothetical protein